MSQQDNSNSGNVSLGIFIPDRNQSDPGPFDSFGLGFSLPSLAFVLRQYIFLLMQQYMTLSIANQRGRAHINQSDPGPFDSEMIRGIEDVRN